MKPIIYTLITFSLLTFSQSCQKDDLSDPNNPNSALCVQRNHGYLGIDNLERYSYKVYVNGRLAETVIAFGYLKLLLPPGTYSLRFVQTGQFVKTPIVKTQSVTIQRCITTDVPLKI